MARLYAIATIRPTLLLTVAVLSYLNVVRGRALPAGISDHLVWLPTVVLCALGAGLAGRIDEASRTAWICLLSWLTAATTVTVGCFGRLLFAILRVRRLREPEAPDDSQPHPARLLQSFWPNTSSLSTSFVRTIGRTSSSSASPSSRLSFVSRPSLEADPFARSPTPASTRHLLDRSASSSPQSLQLGTWNDRGRHDILTFEEIDAGKVPGQKVRHSTESNASPHPTASSVTRSAPEPAFRHSPQVELSASEAFGALVRVGGHLATATTSYALSITFVAYGSIGSSPSAGASYLLILGLCLPSLFLAWQTAASEGIWPSSSRTGSRSNADNASVDMRERSASRASTVGTYKESSCVDTVCTPQAAALASASRTHDFGVDSDETAHARSPALTPPAEAVPAPFNRDEAGIAGIATDANSQDTLIALSLLRSRKARSLYFDSSPDAGMHLVASELGVLAPAAGSGSSASEVKVHEKGPVEIDALTAHILPQLVPSLRIGSGVQIAPNSSASDRRRSLPIASLLDAPRGRSVLLRPKRNRSLPALSFTPPEPEPELDAGRAAEISRRTSGAPSLLSSPDRDRERTETDSSVSGFVLLDNETDESEASSEEEDPRTGTIHCATLRPVSRGSSVSFYGPTLSRHVTAMSLDSAASLTTTCESSTASLTFPERLSWGVWQDRAIVFDSELARRLSGSSAPSAPFAASPQPTATSNRRKDQPRPASWASSLCEMLESSLASADQDVIDSPSYRLSRIVQRDIVDETDENERTAAAIRRRTRPLSALGASPMRKMR
ncbi:hypothetical protein BMF94_5695 [Rhodotorula taiwanensis]|uniref:Uncharacterized protein n=1 Tax=Rhodotorula taiwanensis TaxID=741276 RepID=A0A2S5B3M1_9BASI|nr:hypothetical protein BMF94_5695 [Rhodotorula taiwanensis]